MCVVYDIFMNVNNISAAFLCAHTLDAAAVAVDAQNEHNNFDCTFTGARCRHSLFFGAFATQAHSAKRLEKKIRSNCVARNDDIVSLFVKLII